MGYRGNFVQGEIPQSGAIFMSNIETREECLERKLFGLPSGMSNFVLGVKKEMTLFLFEFERRLLYGVYRATCDGEINIDSEAFRSSGKHFPAQVRFTNVWDCSPLAEHEFRDVISDNYFSGKKFNFGLNKKQVSRLMKLFRLKILVKSHPERNIWSYDDQPSEGNARSGDLRKDIRHRLRFNSCDLSGDDVKDVDDNMYINAHIIEARQKDKREGFLTHYTTESDEFGDCGRHDILGKHLDLREKHIEGGYMPVFSKSHRHHLDEIGVGGSDFLMAGENKDINDYNRLQDEYNVREGFQPSLNEHPSTNHVFSQFNPYAYSKFDPTRINIPDIQLSPSCFDDSLSFIPILDPSPEKIVMSKPLPYYSHNEGSAQHLNDLGSQVSIFPEFISRKVSSPDADVRVHEMDSTHNDKRFCETHEKKHIFGIANKRISVFSRLSSTSRHEEQAFETDEKHELSSSVDRVMKMLEKAVSSPIKRTGKSSPVIKQDDDGDDNSADSKIEDCESPNVNLVDDADVAYEQVEGESVFQETRFVDFKRHRKSNMRTDYTSKESSGCLVGTTSDVGLVAVDELKGMPLKRRKLVRPAFVEKSVIPDGIDVNKDTLSDNDSVSARVVDTSEKVDAFIKSTDDIITVPTSPLNIPDDSVLTKAGIERSQKVDVSIKPIDLNVLPTSDESSPSKDDNNSTKLLLESLHMSTFELQESGNEGDGNAENRLVSDVIVEPTPLASPTDDQKMCGWIEW